MIVYLYVSGCDLYYVNLVLLCTIVSSGRNTQTTTKLPVNIYYFDRQLGIRFVLVRRGSAFSREN